MKRILLHNGTVVNEYKRFEGYIVVEDGMIADIAEGAPADAVRASCCEAFDLQGCWILPGVIDDQVHFRDPGLTHKGDIATESMAAVAGGVTSYMDMPNVVPPTTTLEALEAKYDRAARVSIANYSFFIGATNDNIDTLLYVDYSKTCGVKAFLGSSTGNMLVNDPVALQRLFAEVPALIAVHSEDEATIAANRAKYVAERGEELPVQYHPLIRSAEACYVSTSRAVERAARYGTRLHVLHLSTARELQLFDCATPVERKRITAEVCVHHLWFCDEDYARLGNMIKCNPAVKSAADREALREALKRGSIDIVATDHAPHLWQEKQGNCLKAASGMPLVQFSLVAMLEMAGEGIFTVEQVVDKMCHAPARLYRIDRRGFLRRGYHADIAVVRRGAAFTVSEGNIVSRCGWSPFVGTTFHNSVAMTMVNGNVVYADGAFATSAPQGQRLRFN